MVEALTALALILVAALVDERDRRRRDVAYLAAELAAAETDLRAATGSPRCRRRPAPHCDGFTYTQTIPTGDDLDLWAMEVDGLPWRTWDYGMPTMDTTPDPGSSTPKVAPTVEVSEAMTRACRRISTGELRELVYGGTA